MPLVGIDGEDVDYFRKPLKAARRHCEPRVTRNGADPPQVRYARRLANLDAHPSLHKPVS